MTRDRILVVDDEENIRLSVSMQLKAAGYAVEVAENGEAALAVLEKRDFDAILCDLRMPKLGGMELLEALRTRGVRATVIIMSAYADQADAIAAIRAGATDYIAKPFKKDDLLFRLQKATETQRLRAENARLRAEARGADTFHSVIARSEAMKRVFATVRKVADYKTTVLLTGESGTGKEMIARALHQTSDRSDQAFVTVNCGAIPEQLLESELFGHVRGAFTDAHRDKNGLFLEADGGTILLDEIGDMPPPVQVKLLRVLQEGEVRRLGEARPRPVDVRVVAATLHDLDQRVKEGSFREDLFYRLNVLPIRLPPLRERPDDIPLLVEHFIERHNAVMQTPVRGITPRAMSCFAAHTWPGNVRELENAVERALVFCEGELIDVQDLPEPLRSPGDSVRALFLDDELSIKKTTRALESHLIGRALVQTGGNRTAAAKLLEISHRALLYKIKDYYPDGVPEA